MTGPSPTDAARRMLAEPWPEWDTDPPLVARALLDLHALPEDPAAVDAAACALWAARLGRTDGGRAIWKHIEDEGKQPYRDQARAAVRAALAAPAPTGDEEGERG